MDSKSAAAYIIDPLHAPQPADETGPGSHFGSTFAPAKPPTQSASESSPRASLNSNNPYRDGPSTKQAPEKSNATATERTVENGSPPRKFPDYREKAFGGASDSRRRAVSAANPPAPGYDGAPASNSERPRRRTNSLRGRFPGDNSHKPLDIIRKDSRKAERSPHLKKRHLPGADTIDRLDPAVGGRAYHHEGPYDVTLLARNNSFDNSPLAALQASNQEALKATPQENIRDAVERHKPLDGVAIIPPGMSDRFGRSYNYEEGADLMHEENEDGPGYKRWSGRDYDPDDLKGKGEPTFSLDRALRAHKIDDDGIEMQDRANARKSQDRAGRDGTASSRDPMTIAGGESKYVDMAIANSKDTDTAGNGDGGRGTLKKRIGNMGRKNND